MKENLTQTNYTSAIIDTVDYNICGLKMRPLCLGHIILLEALNNPLISPTEKDVNMLEGLDYFFLALLICSLSYEEGLLLLTDKKIYSEECELFCNNLLKNMELDENWNIYSKMTLFKQYMSEYMNSMPYYEEKQSRTSESPSGNDWKNSIFIIFKKMGYTQSEIFNMSIKKLFVEWTGYAESEGAIKICNKFEAEQLKQLQEMKVKE